MNVQSKKIAFLLLKTLVTLVLVTLLLDLFFTKIVLRSLDESSNYKKIARLIKAEDQREIPIFGSSIAKKNYYPDSIGFRTYNYGLAGSLYHTIEPLLKIELDKDKSTPIIIDFEQHTFFYNENVPVQISNYIPFIENDHVRSFLLEYDYYKTHYDIIGMRYYSSYTDYVRDYLKPALERNQPINKGGVFFKRNDQVFEQLLQKRLNMIKARDQLLLKQEQNPYALQRSERWKIRKLDAHLGFDPNEKQVQSFTNLIQSNPHRTFILVYSPQHWAKLKGLPNYPEVKVLLDSLSKNVNVEVIDMSQEQLLDSYYHDCGHLNVEGAKYFSRQLKTRLEDIL